MSKEYNDNEEKKKLKSRLYDYLTAKGITIKKNSVNTRGFLKCINPSHQDKNPSAVIFLDQENQRVSCQSCGWEGDIFDAAEALNSVISEFPDKLKEVQTVLGEVPATPIKKNNKKAEVKPVALDYDNAIKVYNDTDILRTAEFVLKGKDTNLKIVKMFPFYDYDGNIDLMVVRLEGDLKKHVLTYYYNGKTLKMSGYPVLIYNRNKLAGNKLPILWHEGEKCVDIAEENLPEFIHLTWNGGGKKYGKIQGLDNEQLKERKHYILPDDDQQHHKATGEILPKEDQPGYSTAVGLRNKIGKTLGIEAKVIRFFEKARKVKPDGADIEEVLQCYPKHEILNQILGVKDEEIKKSDNIITDNNSDNIQYSDSVKNQDNDGHVGIKYPFEILGIADDGYAYFLDYEKRIKSYDLTTLTEKKLIDLAGLNFFKNLYGGTPKKDDWLIEYDAIMHLSKKTDFDPDKLKGRGAWRTKTGEICYNDGRKTIGKPDPSWIFIRKPQKDIGLKTKPLDYKTRREIFDTVSKFSFESINDCIRAMAWAVLAPFGGALRWRVMFLLTGESGSGKSTIADEIIKMLSGCLSADGSTSTEPGIRRKIRNDSTSMIVDEAEGKTKKERENKEAIFSMMRASTTDNSPEALKGNQNGGFDSFTMRSMFGFVAINPSIDGVANDNRITQINMVQSKDSESYYKNFSKIKKLITPETCERLRSFTWQNLKKIIEIGEQLEIIIQKVTGYSARFATSESILLAAHMVVWEDTTITDEEFLTTYVEEFYRNQPKPEKRDETSEMIERLLDQTIFIGDSREKTSLRMALTQMKKYYDSEHENWDYLKSDKLEVLKPLEFGVVKKSVEHYGLTVSSKYRELAIAYPHEEIMKRLDVGHGYQKQFRRHKDVVEYGKGVRIDGTTKNCVIIKGVLEYES